MSADVPNPFITALGRRFCLNGTKCGVLAECQWTKKFTSVILTATFWNRAKSTSDTQALGNM